MLALHAAREQSRANARETEIREAESTKTTEVPTAQVVEDTSVANLDL
jgi:hypothetical protein